jgi:hypothetical protein
VEQLHYYSCTQEKEETKEKETKNPTWQQFSLFKFSIS